MKLLKGSGHVNSWSTDQSDHWTESWRGQKFTTKWPVQSFNHRCHLNQQNIWTVSVKLFLFQQKPGPPGPPGPPQTTRTTRTTTQCLSCVSYLADMLEVWIVSAAALKLHISGKWRRKLSKPASGSWSTMSERRFNVFKCYTKENQSEEAADSGTDRTFYDDG